MSRSSATHIGPVSFKRLAGVHGSPARRKRHTRKGASRQQTAAASETVLLVLAEDSPLPDTERDVLDLMAHLRGHIAQLGVLVAADEPALLRAQRLSAASVPDDYVKSRVHLRRLAESVRELAVATERRGSAAPAASWSSRRPWRLNRNVVRAAVFAVAFVVLAIAATRHQT